MRPELERLQAEGRGEVDLTTGLSYGSDTPVVVRVRKRDQRYDIDDDGAAVRLSGEPDGWQEIAAGLAKAHGLNVNGRGVVSVPAVDGRELDALTLSVADTSLALYSALLDTDLEVGFDSDTGVE